MKVSELIPTLVPVPKAKNLDRIGWKDGRLAARFKGRPQLYIYGPGVPEAEVSKILANPYPDRLFKLCIQNRFQCFKPGGGHAR